MTPPAKRSTKAKAQRAVAQKKAKPKPQPKPEEQPEPEQRRVRRQAGKDVYACLNCDLKRTEPFPMCPRCGSTIGFEKTGEQEVRG